MLKGFIVGILWVIYVALVFCLAVLATLVVGFLFYCIASLMISSAT